MYSYGSPHTAAQKQDDQHERTFSSYVRIQVVVLKTYLGRWTIGRSGERGSGISVLPARYDDDIYICIYIYVRIQTDSCICICIRICTLMCTHKHRHIKIWLHIGILIYFSLFTVWRIPYRVSSIWTALSFSLSLYIYISNWFKAVVGRVFTHVSGDQCSILVESYHRLRKWYLMWSPKIIYIYIYILNYGYRKIFSK